MNNRDKDIIKLKIKHNLKMIKLEEDGNNDMEKIEKYNKNIKLYQDKLNK